MLQKILYNGVLFLSASISLSLSSLLNFLLFLHNSEKALSKPLLIFTIIFITLPHKSFFTGYIFMQFLAYVFILLKTV